MAREPFSQSRGFATESECHGGAEPARIRGLLEVFAAAWAAHDIDALMACLAEDVVYDASVGPRPGARYVGRAEVREGMLTMLAHDRCCETHLIELCIHDDYAVVEWRYVTADGLGSGLGVRGVDILRFRDGQIVLKDAFRKSYA
jgi:ketosteroid isomerase-like protein